MTLRPRATAMLDRVTAEAGAVLDEDGAAVVRAAVLAALAPRDALFDDDHDPRCLAPARTVRILIADTACADADVLAAAPFVDSVDARLRADAALVTQRARAILEGVPMPGADGEDLLERIVCAEPEAAVIALAERLDQARHLHLRPEMPWAAFHAEIRGAYIPAARRLAPGLGRRLARWADAFERRLLLQRPRSCDHG